MARVVVNCDDFGSHRDLNLAIVEGFHEGLISSTTMLTNLEGFDHGISLIEKGDLPQTNVGLHFNLTEGIPLSPGIQEEKRFCQDGVFHGQARSTPIWKLSHEEKRSVAAEFEAQLLKMRKHGIQVSHVDGHHHIHTEWGVLQAILPVMNRYNIQRIRVSRTLGLSNSGIRGHLKGLYKLGFNSYLRQKGFQIAQEFGEYPDFFELGAKDHGLWEVMVHYTEKNGSYLLDGKGETYENKIRHFLSGVTLISYSEL
jgi:predicted glycoside hydrolase/deacetylase ChbG (UPF0249 family)